MSASNPFAKFEEKAPANKGSKKNRQAGGGADGQQSTGTGKVKSKVMNIANLLDEPATGKKKKGGNDEQQQQQQASGRGFRTVEGKQEKKPKAKKSEAPQPAHAPGFIPYGVIPTSTQEVDHSDKAAVWAFHKAKEEEEQRKQAQIEKAKKKKWGSGPVGGSVIDPEIEKAERKAAEKLRKHVAKQTVKVKSGGAYADLVRPAEEDAEEVEKPKPQPKKAPVVVIAEDRGSAKQWKLEHTSAQAFADPMADIPQPTQQPVSTKKKNKGNTNSKPAAKPQHHQATPPSRTPEHQPRTKALPADEPMVLDAADAEDAQQATPTGTPYKAKNSQSIKYKQQGDDDYEDEDGTSRAQTRFYFVLENGAKVPVGGHGLTPDEAKSCNMAPKILATQLVKKRPLKGGFFVSVDGKSFLDHTTIDEPWMSESVVVALTKLFNNPDGGAVSAFPCWEASPSEEEHEISMKMYLSTAIELKHVIKHASVRVPLKECRVALKPFAKDIAQQLRFLENCVQKTLSAVADMVTDEKQREQVCVILPRKSTKLRGDLETAVRAFWKTEAELDEELLAQ